jgi:pimeloyl-ACP methyl ester carboxylesterase
MSDSILPRASRLAVFVAVLAVAAGVRAQERVALKPADSHPLVGTFAKPAAAPKGGIVLLPTSRSARVVYDVVLPRLTQAGLAAIALDPRPEQVAVESRPDADATSLDIDAGLDLLVERGAPVDKLAIAGAGAGATAALKYAARTGARVKALVLLAPGKDAQIPSKEELQSIGPRPMLVIATEDEAARGARTLKEVFPGAELTLLPDRLASGTGMFGRVTGIESTIVDWIERALAQPTAIDVVESKLVSIDGDAAASEAAGAAVIHVPLGAGATASVRMTRTQKRLDFGFDIPEPYVRLNEVVIFLDSSGQGGRTIDKSCWLVSFNPKNPARKPVFVKRGGLKGFEDTDDKGVICYARTEEKRRWTAEVSLDLSRFIPGDLPRPIRVAFQINGQRMSDIRYYPDDAKVPTTPGSWAAANLK